MLARLALTTTFVFGAGGCDDPFIDPLGLLDRVRFLSADETAAAIVAEDEWLGSVSTFDRSAWTNRVGTVSQAELVAFLADQAIELSDGEKEGIRKGLAEASRNMEARGLTSFPIPDEIRVGRTTGAESPLPYTRGDTVFMTPSVFGLVEIVQPLSAVMTHEMFHLVTRVDPVLRADAYATLGATPVDPIALPASIADRKLSNPDAPLVDTVMTVQSGGDDVDVAMIALAKKEWEGGNIFDYLELKLMRVEGTGTTRTPLLDGDEPVLFAHDAVQGLYEQIGQNTQNQSHPEEIAAEHFTDGVAGAAEEDGYPDPAPVNALLALFRD
jgi:hypothetical protein